MSGQARKTSVPWIVPITCRQRAGCPFAIRHDMLHAAAVDVVDTRQRGVALGTDELHVDGVAVGLRYSFGMDFTPVPFRSPLAVYAQQAEDLLAGHRAADASA